MVVGMAELTCPNCGHLVVDLPERADLSADIAAGADADAATANWLRRFPTNVGQLLRPFVRAQAHNMERSLTRRIEQRALSGKARLDASTAEVRRMLLDRPLDLRNGRRTTWGKATDADLAEREEMYDEVIAGGQAGKARVQRARAALRAAGARCLEEIEGSERVVWPEEFGEGASGQVMTPTGVAARKLTTSGNHRARRTGKGLEVEAA